jgi:hypothetical protein
MENEWWPLFPDSANQSAFNGPFLITNVSGNSFQYTMTSVPAANPSGAVTVIHKQDEVPSSPFNSTAHPALNMNNHFPAGTTHGSQFFIAAYMTAIRNKLNGLSW